MTRRRTGSMDATDYRETVRAGVLDEDTFVELTLKDVLRSKQTPYRKVVVRPVLVKKKRHLQFSSFTNTQDITKNYRGEDAVRQLDELLSQPYGSIHLRSTSGDVRVRVKSDAQAEVQHSAPAPQATPPTLTHDRAKALPLPPEQPDPFLREIGIQNDQGGVRPQMRAKLTQINEFLKLLDHTGGAGRADGSSIEVLDLGCGSAHLTFAAYHYLNHVRGIPARVTGVDRNPTLIKKCEALRERLGYVDLSFERKAIAEYEPPRPPDLVLSLHACDTATDDALALAVRWEARAVLSAPCCHHYLNTRIRSDVFAPVLRHGILKQRTADILTDAFRALVLRIMGYRTDVIEFINPEHTSRNLMIRAVRTSESDHASYVREYEELKAFWDVTPYLEKLLGDKLQERTNSSAPIVA